MASVSTLMVSDMVTVTPTDTVAEAVRRMGSNRVGAVLVVDRGVLHGLFSERDLLVRVVRESRDPKETWVGDVATHQLVTVDANTSLKDVLEVFRQNKFRHLPVMDAGRAVGILSTRDLLDYIVRGLERYIDEIKYQRELAEGIDPYDHIGGAYGR